MPLEIQPNPLLTSRLNEASKHLLSLGQLLKDAPTPVEMDKFFEWSAHADHVAQGIFRTISDLREHYSRFIRTKDGTLIDKDTIPMD